MSIKVTLRMDVEITDAIDSSGTRGRIWAGRADRLINLPALLPPGSFIDLVSSDDDEFVVNVATVDDYWFDEKNDSLICYLKETIEERSTNPDELVSVAQKVGWTITGDFLKLLAPV